MSSAKTLDSGPVRMPTLAQVILAWIHRLKYLAKNMQATSENIAIAMIPSTT